MKQQIKATPIKEEVLNSIIIEIKNKDNKEPAALQNKKKKKKRRKCFYLKGSGQERLCRRSDLRLYLFSPGARFIPDQAAKMGAGDSSFMKRL